MNVSPPAISEHVNNIKKIVFRLKTDIDSIVRQPFDIEGARKNLDALQQGRQTALKRVLQSETNDEYRTRARDYTKVSNKLELFCRDLASKLKAQRRKILNYPKRFEGVLAEIQRETDSLIRRVPDLSNLASEALAIWESMADESSNYVYVQSEDEEFRSTLEWAKATLSDRLAEHAVDMRAKLELQTREAALAEINEARILNEITTRRIATKY